MDHRTFLAALDPGVKADLTRTSDRAGLRHLAGHAGAILATGGLIAAEVPSWGLLLPVQGVLIVFLFTLEHEATHRTPFANRPLNEAAGHVCGLLLLLPFTWFRHFHLAHHRWTNIAGLDPELDNEKPSTQADWLRHVSGWPYWRGMAGVVWRLATGRERAAWLPEAALPRMAREARAMLALYALAALSLVWSPLLLWVWIVPVILGQPVLRLYLLAEHGDWFAGRAWRLSAGRRHVPEHADHLHYPRGAVPRLEHALSHRTPRLSAGAFPSPARPACPDARPSAGDGGRLCGVHKGLSGAPGLNAPLLALPGLGCRAAGP